MQELGALNVTRSMTADIKNLGFTINLHNGDLAYAECALPGKPNQPLVPQSPSHPFFAYPFLSRVIASPLPRAHLP